MSPSRNRPLFSSTFCAHKDKSLEKMEQHVNESTGSKEFEMTVGMETDDVEDIRSLATSFFMYKVGKFLIMFSLSTSFCQRCQIYIRARYIQ